MNLADLINVRLTVSFAQIDSLATLVSALDGHNTVEQRNQYADQAHDILMGMLGQYATAVYGVDEDEAPAQERRTLPFMENFKPIIGGLNHE